MPIPSFLRENCRAIIALACYLVLAAVALYLLLPVRNSNDRFVLGFVLCFFAILAVKTISHAAADKDPE
jgi:putative copper export protein